MTFFWFLLTFVVFSVYVIRRIRKENKRESGKQFITDEQIERARIDLRLREAQDDINEKFKTK